MVEQRIPNPRVEGSNPSGVACGCSSVGLELQVSALGVVGSSPTSREGDKMKYLSIIVLLLLLSCQRQSLLIVGDSITADGGYTKYLKEQLPDTRIDVRAKPGASILWIYAQVEHYAYNYDRIVVLGGINSILTPDIVIRYLGKTYQVCHSRGMQVIAVTLTPWKNYSTWNEKQQHYTETVNDFIKSKPEGVKAVADVYLPLSDQSKLKEEYSLDGLHPNETGQEVIGRTIYAQIAQLDSAAAF